MEKQTKEKRIILASASPRRRELLTQVGIAYTVQPSACDEKTGERRPAELVEELSRRKALAVYEKLSLPEQEECIVLGADTVVALEEQILGKPSDKADACRMLHRLQGKTHRVYTGVTLVQMADGTAASPTVLTFHEATEVTMFPISDEEIERYVATGEPLDKAGAYAIQGKGAAFVAGINGDYGNVVGLPIGRLCQELKKL